MEEEVMYTPLLDEPGPEPRPVCFPVVRSLDLNKAHCVAPIGIHSETGLPGNSLHILPTSDARSRKDPFGAN